MRNIEQVNIKNSIYYLFNDMINIKNFDWNLLKIDKVIQKYWYLFTLDISQWKMFNM